MHPSSRITEYTYALDLLFFTNDALKHITWKRGRPSKWTFASNPAICR